MTLFETVPAIAAVATAVAGVVISTRGDQASGGKGGASWWLPAVVSLAFLGWTVFAVADGDLTGFWTLHTADAWGNQVWMDLLLAATAAWYLIQPRLRAQGIRPLPWFALVLATGSIGLFAVIARLLYAEHTAKSSSSVGQDFTRAEVGS